LKIRVAVDSWNYFYLATIVIRSQTSTRRFLWRLFSVQGDDIMAFILVPRSRSCSLIAYPWNWSYFSLGIHLEETLVIYPLVHVSFIDLYLLNDISSWQWINIHYQV